MKSHCGDKTILRPSCLHNGISYTGKMASLYWIGVLAHLLGPYRTYKTRWHGSLTRYVKLRVAHAPWTPGTVPPLPPPPPPQRFQRKPLVSDPGMHHGTCVTHVPWCMSGSLTRGDGENVPGIPGACAPAILRISQEAHDPISLDNWHTQMSYFDFNRHFLFWLVTL